MMRTVALPVVVVCPETPALSPRERARFESHIADCPHCTEYLEQMRRTLEVLGRIEPDAIDPHTRDELVSLYRRWVAD